MKRSRRALQARVLAATSDIERARAHFGLAVFHDNNNREAEAIPHYEEALHLQLPEPTRSEALAWLASSLYKTGRPSEALVQLREARVAAEPELLSFLNGLEARISRTLR